MKTHTLPVNALILEGDPGWRTRLAEALNRYVMKVILCVTVKEAKNAWENESPGLIVTEIDLSDGSGLDFIEHVRERDHRVPVVVVSDNTSEEMVIRTVNAGANRFVRKRTALENLNPAVVELLDRFYRVETCRTREQKKMLKRLERIAANLQFINSWLTEINRTDDPLTHLPEMISNLSSIPFLTHIAIYQRTDGTDVLECVANQGEAAWPETVSLEENWWRYLKRSGGLIATAPLEKELRKRGTVVVLDSVPRRLLFYPIVNHEETWGLVVFGSCTGYDRQVREVCGALAGTIAMMFQKNRARRDRQKAEELRRRQEKFLVRAERLAALGSLTSAIGHEINQPLQSIKIIADSTLYWLDSGEPLLDPRTMKESLERISERADWAASIVRSMKTVFRQPESIKIEPVTVDKVARQAISVLRDLPEAREIAFETDLDPKVLTFPFSEVQLKQVLVNLLKNAVRVLADTGRSDGLVRIRTRRSGEVARIEVIDNGPGIPDEIKERVFDPFFSTAERTEGMGLGLYVVHTIARALNCTVYVEDAADGGACFVIEEDPDS